MSDFATIMPDDNLTFIVNRLKNVNCRLSTATLEPVGLVREPESPASPISTLTGPTDSTSPCAKIEFRLKNTVGTGRRGLQNLVWTITQNGATITDSTIAPIVAAAIASANSE
jgi:hypothetical protein